MKFESGRLKETNYKIKNITIEDARLDGELISISNSQMVRTILKLKNREFSQYKLDELLSIKKSLSKKKNSVQIRRQITEINSKIDAMLFIPELISVTYNDRRHFKNILNKGGIQINGKVYLPFMASAGMIRRDSSLYIDADIKEEIDLLFNNNRNRDVEIVPAKFLAYYSLYSSSTIPVSFPKIAVVPDLIIKSIKRVNYSTYMGEGVDPLIQEREMELEFNAFDGEGLCSPKFARTIQTELGLDYLPSILGIRAPFMKGMCVVFDFHKFSQEVAKKDSFVDIYGDEIKVRDVDCIISESQFKLWSAYSSTKEYLNACSHNELGFGITKVNPKTEKNHAKVSYQFLQVLKLTDEQIEKLCEPTLDWLNDVSSGDIEKSLLYMLGETEFSKGWFGRLDFNTRSILIENSLINDSYFIDTLGKSILKKKNDARFGRLYFNANYQTMIADPFALAAYIFGMGLKPLLQDGQHYSYYWNNHNVKNTVAIRSPIVHESEVNLLNYICNEDTNKWYEYIKSGIIFPANGVGMDCAIHGGSDFDLDLVCTINSKEFIDGRVISLPVVYDIKKAEKISLKEDYEQKLHDAQYLQVGTNKIGFLTNLSSTFYSMIYNFEKESPEYKAIEQRLKYGRVSQGNLIDSAKGIVTDPFPEHFAKWKRITDEMTEEERKIHEFYNSIVAEKRPIFMRWLYPHYQKRYQQELSYYNNISQTKWGIPFSTLLASILLTHLTEEQSNLVLRYKRRSFFIDNNSTMNRVSRYIDENLKTSSTKLKQKQSKTFNYNVLLSLGYAEPSKVVLEKAKLLYKEWKSLNRNIRENRYDVDADIRYSSYEQINSYINARAYSTISSNSQELADIMIYLCYSVLGVHAKSFLWKCFGKEVFDNLMSKKNNKFIRVPMLNEKGSQKYLWSRYGTYLLNMEESTE